MLVQYGVFSCCFLGAVIYVVLGVTGNQTIQPFWIVDELPSPISC